MFGVGLIGFASASASAASAVNQAMLFGARALQGAFAALMAPAALSILTITFQHDPAERAKAFGADGAVSGAGGAIGVLAGGLLTEYASWRWCLLVNVPLALVAALPRAACLQESRAEGRPTTTSRGLFSDLGAREPRLRVHQGEPGRMDVGADADLPEPRVRAAHAFVVVEPLRRSRSCPSGSCPSETGAARSWRRSCSGPGSSPCSCFSATTCSRCCTIRHSRLEWPSSRSRRSDRSGRGVFGHRPTVRTTSADGLGSVGRGDRTGLAHADRCPHVVLALRLRSADPHEPRSRVRLSRSQQHCAHQRPTSRLLGVATALVNTTQQIGGSLGSPYSTPLPPPPPRTTSRRMVRPSRSPASSTATASPSASELAFCSLRRWSAPSS